MVSGALSISFGTSRSRRGRPKHQKSSVDLGTPELQKKRTLAHQKHTIIMNRAEALRIHRDISEDTFEQLKSVYTIRRRYLELITPCVEGQSFFLNIFNQPQKYGRRTWIGGNRELERLWHDMHRYSTEHFGAQATDIWRLLDHLFQHCDDISTLCEHDRSLLLQLTQHIQPMCASLCDVFSKRMMRVSQMSKK